MSRNQAKPSSHSSGPRLMELFEKTGYITEYPTDSGAHKCDIERETRAITDDTLKKVMVNFRARLKRVMDKKGLYLYCTYDMSKQIKSRVAGKTYSFTTCNR